MAAVAVVPNTKRASKALSLLPSRIKPATIDDACQKHLALKLEEEALEKRMSASEENLLKLIRRHGFVPTRSTKSKRLQGELYFALATFSSSTNIDNAVVEEMKTALVKSKLGVLPGSQLFDRIFESQTKYSVRPDAAQVLCELPKAAPRKLRKLFKKAVSFTPKKPSVKVEEIEKASS